MNQPTKHYLILGDGGWGTALALYAYSQGYRVTLWGAFADYVEEMKRNRENTRFLPGFAVPEELHLTSEVSENLLESADRIIIATPSPFLRSVLKRFRPPAKKSLILSVTKGIERESLMRMSETVRDVWGQCPLTALSGPSIASEVAEGKPASVVAASENLEWASIFQDELSSKRLRIYTSTDVIGVELGGSLKNPLAIGAGVCDGLGLGSNAKAALMTRGIAEMGRLGEALGGRKRTFHGLSGWGDLLTTCLGGRNRWLGEQLGAGRSLVDILKDRHSIFEGIETAFSARELAVREKVELPIINEVCELLEGRKKAAEALESLMNREVGQEFDF